MSFFKVDKNDWPLDATIYNVHKTDDQHPPTLRTQGFSYVFKICVFLHIFTYANLLYIASFNNMNWVIEDVEALSTTGFSKGPL